MSHDESQDHLDPRHIKLIRLERQALYRSRTYRLVFGIACIGAAAQLVYLAVNHFRIGNFLTCIIELIATMILTVASVWLLMRAHQIQRRASQSDLQSTAATPDFSTLSDGSQFADRLSEMTRPSTEDDDMIQ